VLTNFVVGRTMRDMDGTAKKIGRTFCLLLRVLSYVVCIIFLVVTTSGCWLCISWSR